MSDTKFILAVGGGAALVGAAIYAAVSGHHSIEWWGGLVFVAWGLLGALIVIVFLSTKDVISAQTTEWDAWKPQIHGSIRPPRPSSLKTRAVAGVLILICAAVGALVIYAGPRAHNPVMPPAPPPRATPTVAKADPPAAPPSPPVVASTNKPKGKSKPSPEQPKYPKMRDLFIGEFPTLLKVHGDSKISYNAGSSVEITFQLYLDFLAKSKFIGFFIPAFPDTYQVCADLSSVDPEEVAKGVSTSGGIVGQATEQKDLVFTGRVYLYHESDLSIEQRATLVQLYRSKHLDVQFRGYDYFLMQNLAK